MSFTTKDMSQSKRNNRVINVRETNQIRKHYIINIYFLFAAISRSALINSSENITN